VCVVQLSTFLAACERELESNLSQSSDTLTGSQKKKFRSKPQGFLIHPKLVLKDECQVVVSAACFLIHVQ
jgi:hypothetical protein